MKHKSGAAQDELLNKLVIECVKVNSKGKTTTYYYCIACDARRANNANSHAMDHCNDLASYWPKEFKEVTA